MLSYASEPNAAWPHGLRLDLDLDDLRKNRDRMKLALSRYGRIPIDFWEEKETPELRYWYELLRELIDGESVVQGHAEDNT